MQNIYLINRLFSESLVNKTFLFHVRESELARDCEARSRSSELGWLWVAAKVAWPLIILQVYCMNGASM